jgi:hypothetical protein
MKLKILNMKKIYKNASCDAKRVMNGFKYLLLICFLFVTGNVWGQVSSYAFSQSSGTYTPITGGTNIASTTASALDDNVNSSALPIGFTFNYNGVNYTDFGYNANGWISLGTTLPTSSPTALSIGTTNNVIAALNNDLIGRVMVTGNRTSGSKAVTVTAGDISQLAVGDGITASSGIPAGTTITAIAGSTITMSANATSASTGFNIRVVKANAGVRYQTIGSAPNRQLVVQWTGFNRYATSGAFGEVLNFQIILKETTNIIEIIYNILGPSSTAAVAYQVGLRGASSSDFNNRSSTSTWTSSTAGTANSNTITLSNTVKPTSGQTFTWTPPSPCAAPTSLAASASSSSQTNTTISGSFTAAPTAPTGYIVVRSTSSTQPTSLSLGTALPAVGNTTAFGAGTNVEYVGTSAGSWVSSGLTAGTTYYYYVFSYNNASCTGGPAYSASATTFSQSTASCTGAALASLSYTTSTASYCTGNVITANTASLGTTNGVPTYTISPALPSGLSLNASTGAISGTPTTAQSSTNYTITADNGCTNTTASISIEIFTSPAAPTSAVGSALSYTGFSANWTTNGATSYLLDVATDASFTNLVSGFNALNVGNVNTYSVTGLNAGNSYFYRVRGVSGSCISANSTSQTVTTTAIASIASGNWNASSTWNSGTVPTCGDNITIASTHNVTVNSSSNVSKNLTIASGGTLTVSSGDLTVGCTLNNTPLTNNGTLTVSGGTLNVNGNIVCASGSTFNQSGGDINIDGNNGGSAIGSVASGTALLQFNQLNSGINLTGGTLTIIDPHAHTTSTNSIGYSNGTFGTQTSTAGHTLRFGNGISTDAGGNINGFRVDPWTSTAFLSFGNIIVNGSTGINRSVTCAYQLAALGDVTVTAGSTLNLSSALIAARNITVNSGGTFINLQGITTAIVASNTSSTLTFGPSTFSQTIGGSGTYQNLLTSPTASLTSLTVNNSNATGVTISVPLSISSSLTMTAGRINTTTTNLLTLGTTTAAGTLTYTAGQIVGPFARTFAASRTAAGTYDATTLFPVGDGTNYIPIHIDPTTTSGGAVVMRSQAFNTNSGTGGTGVATTLSSDRWEALVTSGSSNLTNCFVGLNDAQIAAGNIIAQSATANGTYNIISPASTAVAGTSIRTATAISAADYSGYFTYAAPGPRITSFTPTTACPNAATTIIITGTNLGSATSVTLNGEACTITANTATSITATTDATPQAGNVVVTTAANSATSATAMTLFTLPTVTAASNAASNTVCSGTGVTLNGAGATTYAWNNSVTDNTSFTPSTSSNYTVTGTDGNGCTNTASISITVNQIVAITTQPSNQVVLPSANATFTVAATGTGLTYQWEESTDNGSTWNPITNGGVYSGATTNSLLLTSINSSYNNNQYRVVINGTAPCNAETSSAATLTLSNTAITAHPQNETICSSSGTANFSITTSGTTPAYQWQISSDNGVSWNDIPGENSTTLSLSGLTLSNSLEQYRCQLDFGAINSNAATLTVYDPPVINTQPTNLTACSNATSGSFSVSASGSNLTYQWQVSTDGGSSWNNVSGSNISGATTSSLSFSSFTNAMNSYQYRVVVSGSSPCTSVTSNAVTLNITGISVSASASTVCQNSPVTFTVTPNAGSPTLSYSWTSTTGSGASTAVTTNPASITPTASGSYTYTLATTGGGCTFSNTSAVTVNPIPNITKATATPATICSGEALTLTGESVPASTGTSTSSGSGTGFTSSSGYPTFFGNYWYQDWSQILYTASELTSMGLVSGNITALRINVGALPSPTTINGYSIRLGSTSNTSVSGFQTSGLTTVFNPGNYTVASTGNVTINFSTPFFWDGLSSIVVDVRGTGQYSSANATINASITVQNTVASAYTSSNNTSFWTSSPTPTLSKLRPNIVFNGQVGTNQTSNFTWSWNSSPALSVATGTTTETNNGASATNKTYTVTATNATTGCSNTATTSAVTINPATIAPTATNSSQCGSATPSCSVSGTGTAGNTFRWYTAATGGTAITGQTAATLSSYPVSSNTTFHVSESNGTCESPRTQVDVTVSTPPTISVAATVNPVCSGSPTLLSASSSNTGYTYAWSNSLGSGASVTASPTANTTYTVTATDNSGGANNGCATTGSIAVTTNPIPSVLTLSPSVTTGVCNGSIQTISLTSGGTMTNQTIMSENFNTGVGTFTVTAGSSTATQDWAPQTNGYVYSSSTFSGSTNGFMFANSDVGGSTGTTNTQLTSSSFSTIGASSMVLSFREFLNNTTTSKAAIEISDDNFTTFTILRNQISTDIGSASAFNASTISIPSTFENKANVKIRFNYIGAYDWFWAVDEVALTGTITQPITWSPITDLYTDVAATTAYTGTAVTTLYAKPTANRTYTATATIASTGCTNTKTVQLNNRVPTNNVVLASATTSGAVEQCTDANGWTYYATAAKPDEWLFGIHKNGNTFTATVDINVDPTNKYQKSASSNGANQEHASYIMSRYWNATLSSGSIASSSSVKVRFFIDPQDITDLLDERDDDYDDLKNTTNTGTFAVKSGFEWFKTVASTYSPTNWNGNTHSGTIVKLTEDAVATLNGQTYVELSGITSFSGGSGGAAFGPTSNGLFNNAGVVGLPVTWHKVDVQTLENGNEVVWSTSSEQNTSHFEVEYSDDAVQFYKVSENIPAAGNSSTTQYYKFLHESEMKPWLYYRVKQVDLDGKVDYSKIVIAKRASKLPDFKVLIYPIPLIEGELKLDIHSIAQTDIQIRVIDLLGKEVYREKIPSKGYRTLHELQLDHLPKGQYQIQVDNSVFSHQQRLVLLK